MEETHEQRERPDSYFLFVLVSESLLKERKSKRAPMGCTAKMEMEADESFFGSCKCENLSKKTTLLVVLKDMWMKDQVYVCKHMDRRLKVEESKGKERAQDKSKNLATVHKEK